MLKPYLFVENTTEKGRGVFTHERIPANTIIEIAPVVTIPIYNHSYKSNCEYFMDFEDDTIMVKTVRIIENGEELTINYNGDWNDGKKVWFDVK